MAESSSFLNSAASAGFDITASLPSLQFELGLTNSEIALKMDTLRARSHAIIVSQCAQAVHFVYTINKARMLVALSKHKAKKMAKFTGERMSENPSLVGILGCGRLGSQLAALLLDYARVRPSELFISTRRPEIHEPLSAKGVSCFYDNARLARSVDILFLCVLPGQVEALTEDVKSQIQDSCILYSFVATYRPKRLKILLNHCNVIVPEYTWDDDGTSQQADGTPPWWDYSMTVSMALGVLEMVEVTCPLNCNKEKSIISTNTRFADIAIYAFANVCTACNYSRSTVVKLINLVLFGISEREQKTGKSDDRFVETDLTKRIKHCPQDMFPRFDLTLALTTDTPALEKLTQNENLRTAYRQTYAAVFTDCVGKSLIFNLKHVV